MLNTAIVNLNISIEIETEDGMTDKDIMERAKNEVFFGPTKGRVVNSNIVKHIRYTDTQLWFHAQELHISDVGEAGRKYYKEKGWME